MGCGKDEGRVDIIRVRYHPYIAQTPIYTYNTAAEVMLYSGINILNRYGSVTRQSTVVVKPTLLDMEECAWQSGGDASKKGTMEGQSRTLVSLMRMACLSSQKRSRRV